MKTRLAMAGVLTMWALAPSAFAQGYLRAPGSNNARPSGYAASQNTVASSSSSSSASSLPSTSSKLPMLNQPFQQGNMPLVPLPTPTPDNVSGSYMKGFEGLGCLGMTGRDFIMCMRQNTLLGGTTNPLFMQGGNPNDPAMLLSCNQYIGVQYMQCHQQLTDWWRNYNASLKTWWGQLQDYMHTLMLSGGVTQMQLGTGTGSLNSSSNISPTQNGVAQKQYWEICSHFNSAQQQRCMRDAFTNPMRFQTWADQAQGTQMGQSSN